MRRIIARIRRWPKWVLGIVAGLVIALIIGRAMLPSMILRYVNRQLNSIDGYSGHVDDIDVHLYRGAYEIRGLKMLKTGGDVPVPLFEAKSVDLSLLWSALFRGSIVGKIYITDPAVNFVDDKDPAKRQAGEDRPWIEVVKTLFPFRLDRVEAVNAQVSFKNLTSDPPVDIYLDKVHVVATNLTNSKSISTSLVATIEASGLAMNHAPFEVKLKVDPYAEKATFALAAKLENLNVVTLNNLMKAYAGFDMERGTFTLVTELDVKEGKIEGYLKPLFVNLQVLNWKGDVDRDKDNPLQLFWEAIVEVTTDVFKNQPHDQLATKIPIKGDIDNPKAGLLAAIGGVLRNAFIQAFQPRLEGEVAYKLRKKK